jgi:hypothetical protein
VNGPSHEESRPRAGSGSSTTVMATTCANCTANDKNRSQNAPSFGLSAEDAKRTHLFLANKYGLRPDRIGYLVVVEISDGKYRRRSFLSLAAATAAVERAESRGAHSRIALYELRPLGGGA